MSEKQKNKQMKFEDALKRLEEIVDVMEKGELSLDETVSMFEEGIELSQLCQKKLDEAEKKVQILLNAGKKDEKAVDFGDESSEDVPF